MASLRPVGDPDEQEMVKGWLEDLASPRRPLTSWEETFVESLTEQVDAGQELTERQVEILQQLHERKG